MNLHDNTHNVNPEGQWGESTGRSEMLVSFFRVERGINLTNVAKNPSQGQNTNWETRNLFQSHKSNV